MLQRILSLTPDLIPLLPPASDSIANALFDLNCCALCIIRFFGIKQKAVIQQAVIFQRTRSNFFTGEMHRSKLSPTRGSNKVDVETNCEGTFCPACLGLLHGSHRNLISEAKEVLLKEGYEKIDTFLVSCRVPPQIATRTRAIHLCLQHQLAAMGIEYIPPVPTKQRGSAKKEDVKAVDSQIDALEKKKESTENAGGVDGGKIVTAPDETVDVKDIMKVLITDAYSEAMGWRFDPDAKFQLEVGFDHPATEGEYSFMRDIPAAEFSIKKRRQGGKAKGSFILEGASWESISKAAQRLTYDDFASADQIPLTPIFRPCHISELKYLHQSIFLAGRYNKLERGVSNSKWEINGERIAEYSVE
ncbi:putative tRNA pseudouridine synthase Pus10, partial [Dinochytrium kinnereticum]